MRRPNSVSALVIILSHSLGVQHTLDTIQIPGKDSLVEVLSSQRLPCTTEQE
jgi:hypothetical protein